MRRDPPPGRCLAETRSLKGRCDAGLSEAGMSLQAEPFLTLKRLPAATFTLDKDFGGVLAISRGTVTALVVV